MRRAVFGYEVSVVASLLLCLSSYSQPGIIYKDIQAVLLTLCSPVTNPSCGGSLAPDDETLFAGYCSDCYQLFREEEHF